MLCWRPSDGRASFLGTDQRSYYEYVLKRAYKKSKENDIILGDIDFKKVMKERLNSILAKNCNKSLEEITRDTDRNFYIHGAEAVEYGIVDSVL